MEKKFGSKNLIPMWIADMDLPTAQPIIEAMAARNKQGIFGYTTRPASYFEAVCDWQKRRNGWEIDRSLITFNVGVVPVLCTLVREFSQPGDSILFLTPVYSEFFGAVENWGRKPLTIPLREDNGYYSVDFTAFEEALKQKPAFFILCNPHNPVGRAWTREELTKMGELCLAYGVTVVSDEIHSDLMLFGHHHTPFASISPAFAANTVSCISATKTFNLAGLQASSTVFPNKTMMEQFEAFWHGLDIHRNNCFSLVAVETAFRQGEEWLEQLLAHLESNITYVEQYLKENIPEVKLRHPECTYLLWLDCRSLGLEGDALPVFMAKNAGLALNDGRSFGEGGAGFMRMNIACPRCTVEKAMSQLKAAVDAHMSR